MSHRYITLSVSKYHTESAFLNLNLHDERKNTQNRKNIDSTKTFLNSTLLHNPYASQQSFLKHKAQEIKEANTQNKTKHRMIREGSSTFFSLIVQATNQALSFEEHQAFLKECYECIKKHFKEQELLQVTVHNDETTPHLHFKIAFFNHEKKKFNQKDLLLSKHDRLETLFQVLEPIATKYHLQKPPSLEERIENIQDPDQKNAIMHLSKKEQRTFLKQRGLYGGEAYTPPHLLKLHEHHLNALLEENIDPIKEHKSQETHSKIVNFLEKITSKEARKEGFFSKTIKGYYVDLEYVTKLKKAIHFLIHSHKDQQNSINTMQKILNTFKAFGMKDIHHWAQMQEEQEHKAQMLLMQEKVLYDKNIAVESMQQAYTKAIYEAELLQTENKQLKETYMLNQQALQNMHTLKKDKNTLTEALSSSQEQLQTKSTQLTHTKEELNLAQRTIILLKEELKELKDRFMPEPKPQHHHHVGLR